MYTVYTVYQTMTQKHKAISLKVDLFGPYYPSNNVTQDTYKFIFKIKIILIYRSTSSK